MGHNVKRWLSREIHDSINWGGGQIRVYKQLIKEQLKVKASVLSADLRLTPSRVAIFIGL